MTEQGPGCVDEYRENQEATPADDAWNALHTSLRGSPAPCHARDPFTADRLSDDQLAECASICDRCPVFDPCRDYADAANVRAGFWAGRSYPIRNTDRAVPPGNQRKETLK